MLQSLPGPRRRFVSQPSPMWVERPGRMRLWRCPKNMSLHATTSPPFSIAARSTSFPVRTRPASKTGSPYTRNRATPPSGKIEKRRCVATGMLRTSNSFRASPLSGDFGSTLFHCVCDSSAKSSGGGVPLTFAASRAHDSG